MEKTIPLNETLRSVANKHLVLLESHNSNRKSDTVQLRLSGYADVMYLISDIVKVCILALDDGGSHDNVHIPEPGSNISGVLGIILNLIPYEEADLLDKIRESVLSEPENAAENLAEAVGDAYDDIFLSMPQELLN